MTNGAIRVTDVAVERGGKRALHNVTFSVQRGSVTGLLGPSGSGKTTLIRAIVGVQILTSGSIRVLGMPSGSAALRRHVGYVTQAPSVYGDLTVHGNARYFAALVGVPSSTAESALHDVGLAKQSSQLVNTLSGGERARVSLACALIGSPPVLLLDEPTVGLDPVLRRDLWQLFADLARDGTTLLISSHVMDEASHCERLLLLREGQLIADETPEAIASKTGTKDLEQAFLRLIEHGAVVDSSSAVEDGGEA